MDKLPGATYVCVVCTIIVFLTLAALMMSTSLGFPGSVTENLLVIFLAAALMALLSWLVVSVQGEGGQPPNIGGFAIGLLFIAVLVVAVLTILGPQMGAPHPYRPPTPTRPPGAAQPLESIAAQKGRSCAHRRHSLTSSAQHGHTYGKAMAHLGADGKALPGIDSGLSNSPPKLPNRSRWTPGAAIHHPQPCPSLRGLAITPSHAPYPSPWPRRQARTRHRLEQKRCLVELAAYHFRHSGHSRWSDPGDCWARQAAARQALEQ